MAPTGCLSRQFAHFCAMPRRYRVRIIEATEFDSRRPHFQNNSQSCSLNARLSSAEKTRLERRPTQSGEAYDLYLRGREYQQRPGYGPRELQAAEQMFR